MIFTAAILALLDAPITWTVSGAVGVALVVLYRIITDRSAVNSELEVLKRQISELSQHVARLEALYDEQRGLKHQAFNDVARALTALELVRGMAEECTCGALGNLPPIIERVLVEMETSRRSRLGLTDEG